MKYTNERLVNKQNYIFAPHVSKEIPNGGSTEAKRIEANNSIEIEQNDPVKPTRKRKRPEPKKDVILLPWINESTLLNETTKTVSVVEQVTGTPCSQVSGNESCMEGQLSDPPPMVCSDRHQIVRLKELTYYKTGKGEFTKAPANACRICKRSRSFWACLNCSEDTRPFPIHHPTVNPQCYQKHIKVRIDCFHCLSCSELKPGILSRCLQTYIL